MSPSTDRYSARHAPGCRRKPATSRPVAATAGAAGSRCAARSISGRKRRSDSANSTEPMANKASRDGHTTFKPAPRNRIAWAKATKWVEGDSCIAICSHSGSLSSGVKPPDSMFIGSTITSSGRGRCAAIASSAEACQRWLAQDPPNVDKARQTVARILADAHRAGDVIARIRGLTQGAAPERQAFDLSLAVEEMLALSRSELEQHGVTVALVLGSDLPPAHADRVQVQQVIGNLILNAVDAMEPVPAADRRLSLLTRRDGQRVSLSVRDRGVGLPADHPERVFDAFWTTKSHGLGLGLSLSRSMIEANGGHIRAERPAGGGACFIFELPTHMEATHA